MTALLSCLSSHAKISASSPQSFSDAANQQRATLQREDEYESSSLVRVLGKRNRQPFPIPALNRFPDLSLVHKSASPSAPEALSKQDDEQLETADKEGGDEEDEADAILQRIRLYQMQHGNIDPEEHLRLAKEQYKQREAEKSRHAAAPLVAAGELTWVSLGPTNGAGRMTAIAPHPIITGTVYVGADSGGVWKTTDGGATWTNLTDSINNLLVGALALTPSSPNVIYLGTGSEHGSGIGLLKSTDGGATWSFPKNVVASRFYRISVHPANPQDLVAATSSGAFRSTDGGVSWTQVFPQSSYYQLPIYDLVRHPTNPQVLYATAEVVNGSSNSYLGTRVLMSTDDGVTWVERSSGLRDDINIAAIAISQSNPLVLYVSTNTYRDALSHIYKTTNGGASWSELPVAIDSRSFISHFLGSQAAHDNTITVSPTDPNLVIAAGIGYIRSDDGGLTWDGLKFASTTTIGVQPDATDLRYQGSTLYIANDGGIYSTPDNGDTVDGHNNRLVVRQYYSLWNDPVVRNRVLAGAQDKGTDRRDDVGGTSWVTVSGNDAFDCVINPLMPYIAYSTYQYGAILRTKDVGKTRPTGGFSLITPTYSPGESAPFRTILTMDLSAPSNLYTGTYRVWKTSNGGDSWSPLPTTTTDGSTWDVSIIRAIAVARANSAVLMVIKNGYVFRSTNGGASWVKIQIPALYPYFVEIDPKDSNTAYLGGSSFQEGNNLYVTTDGGTSWKAIGIKLPLNFIRVVRIDPTNSQVLYCGTDFGVYRSIDQGASWAQLGAGLPVVTISDLRLTDDGAILRAATYGRGVWELQLRPASTSRISGRVTDASGNGVSNIYLTIDVGGYSVAVANTDSNGNYSFANLTAGRDYTVGPAMDYGVNRSYIYNQQRQTFDNLNGDQTADFTATLVTYNISGRVMEPNGAGISDVTVTLSGYESRTVQTDANGNYSFPNLRSAATYTIKVAKNNYTFSPISNVASNLSANQTINFKGVPARIGGRVADASNTGISDVTMTLSGTQSATVTTDDGGNYSFGVLTQGGQYVVTPSKANYTFSLSSASVSNLLDDVKVNFIATAQPTPTPTPSPTPTPISVQFSAANYSALENAGAAIISVVRSGNTTTALTVDYATADGTANQRNNYTSASGTLSFDAGETTKTFSVLLINNAYADGPRTVSLTLSNPSNNGILGNQNGAVLTIMDDDSSDSPSINPIDDAGVFVRQHYLDFLNREADAGGLNYWTSQITTCGTDAKCVDNQRIGVSAAYFIELEFQDTGSFVYRMYKGSFGRQPTYSEFVPDRSRIVGGSNLEASKQSFAESWTGRAEFLQKYPASISASEFVDALLQTVKQTSGVDLSGQRQTYINQLSQAGGTRGAVVRAVIEDGGFKAAEYNRAFVLMQYFGYLRRDADAGGYNFWLDVLSNKVVNNYRSMVCAFITSKEYQDRFSSVTTRNDSVCTGTGP